MLEAERWQQVRCHEPQPVLVLRLRVQLPPQQWERLVQNHRWLRHRWQVEESLPPLSLHPRVFVERPAWVSQAVWDLLARRDLVSRSNPDLPPDCLSSLEVMRATPQQPEVEDLTWSSGQHYPRYLEEAGADHREPMQRLGEPCYRLGEPLRRQAKWPLHHLVLLQIHEPSAVEAAATLQTLSLWVAPKLSRTG